MLKNTVNRYGTVHKSLHWLMALLIIFMLALGLLMGDLGENIRGSAYSLHKSIGICILALVSFRLIWRIMNPKPKVDLPLWQRVSAHCLHGSLYIMMFFMPLTGWAMTNASGRTLSFFGLFDMPAITPPNPDTAKYVNGLHEIFANLLIAMITLHALAALYHHFIRKDEVLRRMLPSLK